MHLAFSFFSLDKLKYQFCKVCYVGQTCCGSHLITYTKVHGMSETPVNSHMLSCSVTILMDDFTIFTPTNLVYCELTCTFTHDNFCACKNVIVHANSYRSLYLQTLGIISKIALIKNHFVSLYFLINVTYYTNLKQF